MVDRQKACRNWITAAVLATEGCRAARIHWPLEIQIMPSDTLAGTVRKLHALGYLTPAGTWGILAHVPSPSNDQLW